MLWPVAYGPTPSRSGSAQARSRESSWPLRHRFAWSLAVVGEPVRPSGQFADVDRAFSASKYLAGEQLTARHTVRAAADGLEETACQWAAVRLA
ncbi:MAG: hypothetical protein JSU73_05860 [candidate division WOR-3 bacterium]|nr:MAG: hypothetical protein JSU73_05860 [candidate division WOR-3 bacterium]